MADVFLELLHEVRPHAMPVWLHASKHDRLEDDVLSEA